MLTRSKAIPLGVLLSVVMLALAACAPTAAPAAAPAATSAPAAAPTNPSAATTAPTAPMAKAVTLQIAGNDKLGKFLADGDGNTLYLFTKDTKGTSNCNGKCAQAWPPVIPDGQPTLKDGVNATVISTTVRKDGSVQLTYNGWPVYYWYKDKAPGDTTGQAVDSTWWVISGEGNPIKPAALAITPTEKLGKILVDGAGRTLYVFTKDSKDTSACYDKCEAAWAPLLQTDKPTVSDGVDASMLGTTARKDGTSQVTYNGMPLYYFIKDQAAGDTNGQGVANVWYVLGGDGQIMK